MTFEAYIYIIPGLLALIWPLLTLLVKREVTSAQWVLMGALLVMGLCMILYSTFFMPCFRHEHLICHLYVIFALITPFLFLAGVLRLTTVGGFNKNFRRFFILPITWIVIVTAIGQIGGLKNYQRFLATAIHAGDLSFTGDLWYDAMLLFEFYGFLGVLAVEIILSIFIITPSVRKYISLMEDNFVSPPRTIRLLKPYTAIMLVMILLLVLLEISYPLHFLKSRVLLMFVCISQSFIVFTFGYFVYHIHYSAERLIEMRRDAEVVSDQYRKLGLQDQSSVEQVCEQVRVYMEDCKGCLDPTISVFKIARQLHLDQDVIVQAIHLFKGISFAEYVNSLRIEYAIGIVMERLNHGILTADPYDQRRFADSLAASCGYPTTGSFHVGFAQVMGQPYDAWMHSLLDPKQIAEN